MCSPATILSMWLAWQAQYILAVIRPLPGSWVEDETLHLELHAKIMYSQWGLAASIDLCLTAGHSDALHFPLMDIPQICSSAIAVKIYLPWQPHYVPLGPAPVYCWPSTISRLTTPSLLQPLLLLISFASLLEPRLCYNFWLSVLWGHPPASRAP